MEKITPLFTVVVTKFYSNDAIKNTLSLSPDEIIQVLATPNKVWWDGIIVDPVGNVTRGWFPAKYTSILNSPSTNSGMETPQTSNAYPPIYHHRSPVKNNKRQNSIINSYQNHNLSNNLRKSSLSAAQPHSTSISTIKNYEDPMMFSSSDDITNFNQKHHNSLASGKSFQHELPNSRQHSQALTEATNSSSVHLITTDEAVSYFQSANPISQPGFNFVPVWIPQLTEDDDIVYFNQALNIHSHDLPFIQANYQDANSEYEVPNFQKLMSDISTPLAVKLGRDDSFSSSNQFLNSDEISINQSDRQPHNQSGSNQQHTQIISPKLVNKIGRDLSNFYTDKQDIMTWDLIFDQFITKIQSITVLLKENNKAEFTSGVNQTSQIFSSIIIGLRSLLDEIELKNKKNQFSLLIKKLSALILDWRISTQIFLVSLEIIERDEFFAGSKGSNKHKENLIKIGPDNLSKAERLIPKIIRTFALLLKFIKSLNYHSPANPSANDYVPIIYPRFVKNKFEGGNFKNQFNESASDDLFIDSKVQSNLLLDDDLIKMMESLKEKVDSQLSKVDNFLHKSIPENVPLDEFIKQRNLELLTMIYQTIPSITNYLKSLESVDFTVFTIINKLSSNSVDLRHDTIVSTTESNDENNQWFYDTTTNMIKPMLIEFTQLKQGIHSCATDLILDSQTITAEDPEVFFAMKMDNDELLSSLNLRVPNKSDDDNPNQTIYDKAVNKFSRNMRKRLEVIDKLLFNDGLYSNVPVLKLMETIRLTRERMPVLNLLLAQLKDQRMLILNYCTRLMNTDFNIASLFIAERHNTLASTSSQINLFYGDNENHNQIKNPASKTTYDKDENGYLTTVMGFENPHLKTRLPWFLDIDEEEKDLIYDFNGLKGGTVDGLISKLIDPLTDFDKTFEDSFLMLFASFTTPLKLLQSLITKYDLSMPEALSYEEYNIWIERKVKPQQIKITDIFEKLFSKYWLVQYSSPELFQLWKDFTSEKEHILQIPVELVELGFNVLSESSQNDYYSSLNLYPENETVLPMSPLTSDIAKVKLSDLDIDEVAKQLTAIQSFYYRKINRNDLLFRSYNFSKLVKNKRNDKSKVSFDSKNITNFIKNCNLITNYTSYMILRNKDQSVRVSVIKYFIILAEKLLYLKNFSSMTAIISALSSTSIARLKKTWDHVPSSFILKFNKMDSLMSISKNYSEYRNILKFMETDGDPYLPFLGVFLSDLRFTTDGNPDNLNVTNIDSSKTRIVNFSKRINIRNIIDQLLSFNNVKYNYPFNENMVCYFMTIFDNLPDNERMYEMSINIEPRVSLLKDISYPAGTGSLSSIGINSSTSAMNLPASTSNTKRLSSVTSNQTNNINFGGGHNSTSNWLLPDVVTQGKKKSRVGGYRHLLSISGNNHSTGGNEGEEGSSAMTRVSSSLSLTTNDSGGGCDSRSSSQLKTNSLDKVLEVDRNSISSTKGVSEVNKKRGNSSTNTNIQRHTARAVL